MRRVSDPASKHREEVPRGGPYHDLIVVVEAYAVLVLPEVAEELPHTKCARRVPLVLGASLRHGARPFNPTPAHRGSPLRRTTP